MELIENYKQLIEAWDIPAIIDGIVLSGERVVMYDLLRYSGSLIELVEQQRERNLIEKEYLEFQTQAVIKQATIIKDKDTLIESKRDLLEALGVYAAKSHWTTAYYHSEHGRAKVSAMYRNNPWDTAQSVIQKVVSHTQEGAGEIEQSPIES